MARLSLALPLFERCERPSTASVRPCRLQPGRLAQGPDEKCGTDGRTPGIAMLIHLPFQIAASRWGEVSRQSGYATGWVGSTCCARYSVRAHLELQAESDARRIDAGGDAIGGKLHAFEFAAQENILQ